jgi:hypothetical protein
MAASMTCNRAELELVHAFQFFLHKEYLRIYRRLNLAPITNIKDILAPSMVSGSSPVIAHMMATGDLHGR